MRLGVRQWARSLEVESGLDVVEESHSIVKDGPNNYVEIFCPEICLEGHHVLKLQHFVNVSETLVVIAFQAKEDPQ